MRPGTAHRQQQKNVLQAITLPFLPYSDTDPTALRLIKYSGFVCRMPSNDVRAHSVIQKDRMCPQELCIVQRCWRECVDSFICVQSWIVRKWNVFYDFRSTRFCSHGNVASARVTEFRRLRLLFIIITCYCVTHYIVTKLSLWLRPETIPRLAKRVKVSNGHGIYFRCSTD